MKKLSMESLGRLSPNQYLTVDKLPIVVILDNIRSMHNIGSVFRTADAFRISEIYLCGITTTPPHREIHKTALGATETVSWKYFPETATAVEALKREGYTVFALEQTDESVMLNAFSAPSQQKIGIVLGNEVDGVQDAVLEMCDGAIEIPQFGTKHSLNVSVASGIVLWHLSARFFHLVAEIEEDR